MGESGSHRKLLLALAEWTRRYCESLGGNYSVCIDHLADDRIPKPPLIVSSVPDVYAKSLASSNFIIGEAETATGLLGKHTDKQISDFIHYCSNYDEALFVLAVPWDMALRAKSIIKQTKIESNLEQVQTIVLEQLEA